MLVFVKGRFELQMCGDSININIPKLKCSCYIHQNIMSGKRQRPAHFQIDEKTLQYKQNPEHKKHQVDSEQQIKQRTFYKIKLPGSVDESKVHDSKPQFKLFDGVHDSDKTKEKIEQSPAQQNKQKEQNEQKIQKSDEVPKPTTQNTTTAEKKQQQKKNIFSFSLSGAGTNFFNNGIGIFTNNNASNGEGIFSKNNIFNKKSSDKSEKDPTKTNDMFSVSNSLLGFANAGVPPIKKQASVPVFAMTKSHDDDGEDEQDSKQLQADQKQTVDPTKSTGTYEYSSECETLFQKKAIKVKRDSGQLIENTQIVVQTDKENKSHWVVVRLIATKNPILTGYIIKGKCEVKKLNNKDENVTLSLLTIKQKHPQSHVLKIQFQKPEQGKQLRETIEKIIN